MRTIVVSAVNLNVGGTLTILRECLSYLSQISKKEKLRVVALVHKKELVLYDNIEYIEISWSKKNWINRLWCEYITMYKISKELSPIFLWFSLHDTTPNVVADRRVVYCHNPFPFYKWKWGELLVNYKIVLFSWFSKYIYRINIKRNKFVVVQQQWIRDKFKMLFNLDEKKIIVAAPEKSVYNYKTIKEENCLNLLYPSSANLHKNFELLCAASEMLEKEIGEGKFSVTITIKGNENKYAKWLYKKWGHVKSINFAGFMNRDTLFEWYNKADCLVFPSRVETWGLPISEFSVTKKPMLLSNLPYAHETASGSEQVAFFNSENATDLKEKMKKLIQRDFSDFKKVEEIELANPVANSWEELFEILLG